MGTLGEIAKYYAADEVACDGMLASAARDLEKLDRVAPKPETAARLPVCLHLATALEAAKAGPLAAVAAQFAAWELGARWRQNPNYTAQTMGPEFMANYGYVEIVGHNRPWEHESLAIGFLLLGPGAHYRAHNHPAAEVYHVVSGVAEWRQGPAKLSKRPIGCAIYHAPNVEHETRVLAEPCLALYCWTGDIGVAARLS